MENIAVTLLLARNSNLKRHASVLMYHSVGSDGSMLTTSTADLTEQLEYLQANNGTKFTVVSLSHIFKQAQEGKSIAGLVAVTFDDAYENFYTLALPLLKKYNIPVTLFVPTGLLGTTWNIFDGTPLKIMSREMLAEIALDSLIECMPHTQTHPDLKIAKESTYDVELKESRGILEEITKKPSDVLAYPKGSYSEAVIEYLKKNKWKGAVGIDFGLVSDKTFSELRFKLPRNRVSPEMPFKLFRLLLTDSLKPYLRFLAIMGRHDGA